MSESGFWHKLFGLNPASEKQKQQRWEPASRSGHSMTGQIVTNIQSDWSRYDDCMKLSVVGESHYQPALIEVSQCPPRGQHGYECSAELVPEPENPHDKFAVKVMVQGRHVGYLSRGNAKRYGKRIRGLTSEGKQAICMAYIGRGDENPNLGVTLRLPYNGEILQGKK